MENQENSETSNIGEGAFRPEANAEGESNRPRLREIFRQAFEKARRSQQPVTSRCELGKDKSKSLLLLAGLAVVVGLLFLGVFSSPAKPKRHDAHPGTPDLGRKLTPGQERLDPGKSVTPLLDADLR